MTITEMKAQVYDLLVERTKHLDKAQEIENQVKQIEKQIELSKSEIAKEAVKND